MDDIKDRLILVVDPPLGWQYGFPKVCPHGVNDIGAWLVTQGYPESLLNEHGQPHWLRTWMAEDESLRKSGILPPDPVEGVGGGDSTYPEDQGEWPDTLL